MEPTFEKLLVLLADGQIDIFTRMTGLRYRDLLADAERLDLDARTIRYASKAALIRLKENSAREKDRLESRPSSNSKPNPHALD